MTDTATAEQLFRSNPQLAGHSAMDGWEAFAAVPADGSEPIVRELGGTEHWPEPELTAGVAAIFVHCYADSPAGAFVHVAGPDREAVVRHLERIGGLIADGMTASWFEERAGA